MATLLVAESSNFVVELVDADNDGNFEQLVCRHTGTGASVSFDIQSPIAFPAHALEPVSPTLATYRLRTLQGMSAALQSEYRAALHQAARVSLQAHSFFGIDVAGSTSLLLELDLAAVFDGNGTLAGSLSGRLIAHGTVSIATQAIEAGGSPALTGNLAATWTLALRFGTEWTVSLSWPRFGVALPSWNWPASLSLPNTPLPSLDLQWDTPPWLRGLTTSFSVVSTNLTFLISSEGFELRADTITLQRAGAPIVVIERITFASFGGTATAARRIAFPSSNFGPFDLREVLGTPLRIRTGNVVLSPSLVNPSHGRYEPQIGVSIDDLELSEPSGSTLQLGVDFTLTPAGLSNITVTIQNGSLSAELVLTVRELLTGAGQAVSSLVEWTGQVIAQSAAAAADAIGKLIRFLRAIALPEVDAPSMPSPRLPGAGPIRSAFAALLQLLAKAAAELSVQLVFERSSQRLLRTVVSLRDTGSQPLDVRLGGSALQLALRSSSTARPALVVEHTAPSGADWLLLLVDENPTTQSIELSTNLWLAPPLGNPALQQHADADSDSAKAEPLLKITARPALDAIALAGMQAGRPVWFQRYMAGAAVELINGRLRVAVAEGGYGLTPITVGDLNLSIAERLDEQTLPLLRRREDGTGSNLAQAVIVKEARLQGEQLSLQVGLVLGGREVGTGEISARFSPHDLSFVLIDASVQIKIPQDSSFEFLGLTWKLSGPDPSFELSLAGEPSLKLANGTSLQLTTKRPGSAENGLKFNVGAFALTRAGVSLDATLEEDQTLRLPGVDTVFSFQSAELRIRDGSIQEFTVAASGSLPAWVGDAKVKAQFRYGEVGGDFRVLAVHAELETPGKKVDCRALRFEFSLKLIELDFVRNGADEYYFFRLSGSAEFKPSGGEFDGGLLQHLKNARIELDRTPVTGQWSEVLGSLEFTVPLPKPTEISLFNLFRFQIRSIGFDCNAFGPNDPGIKIAGQCQFAEIGDILAPEIDFHALYLGAPAANSSSALPRVRFDGLRVVLQVASRIRIGGTVLAVDRDLPLVKTLPGVDPSLAAKGFVGDGEIEIPGLPPLAASFGFLEISQGQEPDPVERHLSWFVYIEARKLSYVVTAPIPLFIREIGLGMGYRYTLAGIAKADELKDPVDLIKELTELAKRQGDLARYQAWTPQFGGTPQLTLAMRALLTMASAAPPQTHEWDETKEQRLPSPFTMDVVAALRTDLTFLMTVRLWLAVNYADFLKGGSALREHPLVVGFLYLSGARQEFLARLSSVENPYIGDNPVIPPLVQRALKSLKYSATLYMRPGLLHFELGWPDQLQWRDQFGPLTISCVGGFVFRVEDSQLLLGMNFGARGRLELSASAGSGSFGASIAALAEVGFAARMVAVIDARNVNQSMYYGRVAIDLLVTFRVSAWLRIKVFGRRIGFSISFSFSLYVNVSLELVLTGEPAVGGRARARVGIRAFGRTLAISVDLAVAGDKVDRARERVARYLNLGMAGPAELPDPFAQAAPTALSRPRATANKRAALLPESAHASAVAAATNPTLSKTVFTAYARALSRLPDGIEGNAEDYALVALIPKKGQHGYFCSPPKPSGSTIEPRKWDYKIFDLPADSYVYIRSGSGGGWQRAEPEPEETGVWTQVAWQRQLGQTADECVFSLLDGAFLFDGNRYSDPDPREIGLTRTAGSTVDLAEALALAQQGDATDDDDPFGTSAQTGANDARDLILAKLQDSLVEYAETLTPNALCLDLGLVFLIPTGSANQESLKRITVERADIPGVRSPIDAPVIRLARYSSNKTLGGQNARLTSFESKLQKDRIEFAWDLIWDDNPDCPEQDEAEDSLYAYEVVSSIVDGSDGMPRMRLVKPADVLTGSGMQLSSNRSQRQFSDDFADLGGIGTLVDKTVRYAITPIAVDGSHGALYTTTVRLDAFEAPPTPTVAELELRLGSAVRSSRFLGHWEPQAAEIVVKLDHDKNSLSPRRGDAIPPSSRWAKDLARTIEPTGAELVLRPEPIGFGGRYAVDQELGGRESLAQFDAAGPRDLVLPLVRQKGSDGEDVIWVLGDPKPLDVIRASAGQLAWRAYARFTLNQGKVGSAYVPVSLSLVRENKRAPIAVVEWPYWKGLGERAAAAAAGRLIPYDPDGDDQPAGSQQVGYEVSWPAFAEDPQSEPPVEGFVLRSLAIDALPPRLLSSDGEVLDDAWRQGLSMPAADIRICAAEFAALSPAHNQDHENWQGSYARDVPTGVLSWPDVATRYPLPRVEPGLLQHLRGERGWRRYLRVQAYGNCPNHGEVQIPVSWPTGTPGLTAYDGAAGVYSIDPNVSPQQLVSSLRELEMAPPEACADTIQVDRLLIAVADDPSAFNAADAYEVLRALPHPELLHFVEEIALEASTQGRYDVRVEYQSLPTDDAAMASFQALVDATPESKDPYGHSILHRLGLAISVRFWHATERRYLLAHELLEHVRTLLAFYPRLHVDVLLQTERHWTIEPFDPRIPSRKGDLRQDGLALLQVSMRPKPEAAAAATGDLDTWVRRKRADWSVSTDDAAAAWLARFKRHRSPPTRITYLGRRGEPGAYRAPDRDGQVRVLVRTQDRHAQAHAFRVEVRYRYDAIREVLGYPEPKRDGPTKTLVTAIERSREIEPPQWIAMRHTRIACEGHEVPVWEAVVARHPEQALADSNVVVATRLQYLGIATAMRRGPRDPDWLERLAREVPAVRFPVTRIDPRAPDETGFVQAWRNSTFSGDWSVPLWQGVEVQGYPALPYFYRHHLLAQAESRWVQSQQRELRDVAPDIAWTHGPEDVNPTLASNGLARVDVALTRYEDIADPVTLRLAGEQGSDRSLRHAPDPDVQYQIELSDGLDEPLAHILREFGETGSIANKAYRAVALSSRIRATPALAQDQSEPADQRGLRLHIDLCRVDELPIGSLSSSSGLDDFATFGQGLLRVFAPLNDQRLRLLVNAMVGNPLQQAQLIDPLLAAWSWRGIINSASPPPDLPAPLVHEFEHRLIYDSSSPVTDEERKAAIDAWLSVLLQYSVWQSAAIRRLREALLTPSTTGETSVLLLAPSLETTPPPPESGWSLQSATPSGHWLAFGPMDSGLEAAISTVSTAGQVTTLKALALARHLGRSQGRVVLRRWRGVSLSAGAQL